MTLEGVILGGPLPMAVVTLVMGAVGFVATLVAFALVRRIGAQRGAFRLYRAVAQAAARDGVVTPRERAVMASVARALRMAPSVVAGIEREVFGGRVVFV